MIQLCFRVEARYLFFSNAIAKKDQGWDAHYFVFSSHFFIIINIQLQKLNFTGILFSRFSNAGAIILQGPHQGAQKSTTTTGAELVNSAKVWSVTTVAIAILPFVLVDEDSE